MRRLFFLVSFGLVLSMAAAQTTQQQPQTPPVNPSTPANRIGDGAQSKSGTPVTPSTTTPATGGVSGAASSSTAQTPDTQDSAAGVSAMTDSDLESHIQNALSKEPTLSGDSAHVNVTGDAIVLAGTVGTNKEKVTATRIVQSYAGSKKVENKLTIGGRSDKTTPPATDNTGRGRQPGSNANPTNNPEPEKGTPPSKPPQR
jgi:BON domain-containing protein